MRRLLALLIILTLILTACATGRAGDISPTTKILPIEIKGTINDGTYISSSQAGFRLKPDVLLTNLGTGTWDDPDAKVTFTITDPKGQISKFSTTIQENILTRTPFFDTSLRFNQAKVFQFTTDYTIKQEGFYNILVEIESISTFGYTLVSRSALMMVVGEPDVRYIALPNQCGPFKECAGVERCCSKGVDVALEDIVGHCAKTCGPGEMIVPYIAK